MNPVSYRELFRGMPNLSPSNVRDMKEAVNPAKAGDLEKLVLKATNDALEATRKMAAEEMKKLTGGLNIPGLT